MLRITGGEHRGRKLKVPDVAATRPLVERAREGLMNHLRNELPGALVWDVYAGSGILGFEALSRGAGQLVSIEMNAKAARQLRQNAELLRLEDRLETLQIDAYRLPKLASTDLDRPRPDLVFFDPPYDDFRKGGSRRERVWALFCELAALLPPAGVAIVHTPRGILVEEELQRLPGIEQRDYGSTSLYWWHAPPPSEATA